MGDMFTRTHPIPSHINDRICANAMHTQPLSMLIDELWCETRHTLDRSLQSASTPHPSHPLHAMYTLWNGIMGQPVPNPGNPDNAWDNEQQRHEFALQTACVIATRLVLLWLCAQKGLVHTALLSHHIKPPGHHHNKNTSKSENKHDLDACLAFVNGETCLSQSTPHIRLPGNTTLSNLYARFFGGHTLFNWYRLSKQRFLVLFDKLHAICQTIGDCDMLGPVYRTYVCYKQKRKKGQYYTPLPLVQYMLDALGYHPTPQQPAACSARLIDPSCGSGSFLVAAVQRIIAAAHQGEEAIQTPEQVLDQVRNNIYGFDLNPFACYLAEVNLLIQVLDLAGMLARTGTPFTVQPFHIYHGDMLACPHLPDLPGDQHAPGFAWVVGNPPYGAAISNEYKAMLRSRWPDVFFGKPDTYTFFVRLGIDLLAHNGRLGFVMPNTFLTGTNTGALRRLLLKVGRIEQIVDLPRRTWDDANVDCVLLFLAAEEDERTRRRQQTRITIANTLNNTGCSCSAGRLVTQSWRDSTPQPQARWMDDIPNHEMTIRYDSLLQQVEERCRCGGEECGDGQAGGGEVLRLGDVTESCQGIIPYRTRAEGQCNPYIRPAQDVPPDQPAWKPLLDGRSFVGRYELRWHAAQPHLHYGPWLWCQREAKFFESPKLLMQYMRNRSLKHRLVATYDERRFYNRHNFSNITARHHRYNVKYLLLLAEPSLVYDPWYMALMPDIEVSVVHYHLKYVLALINSSLLNEWYSKKFDNVNINPAYFRQLPVYPAAWDVQEQYVALVDTLLESHAALNRLREQGYTIEAEASKKRTQDDGNDGNDGDDGDDSCAVPVQVDVPYDVLLERLQQEDAGFRVMSLRAARDSGWFTLPAMCDVRATIGRKVAISRRHPQRVVLRPRTLWLQVANADVRRYLAGSLRHPRWCGVPWDEVEQTATIPATATALARLFEAEHQQRTMVLDLVNEVERLDHQIDEMVRALYGMERSRAYDK